MLATIKKKLGKWDYEIQRESPMVTCHSSVPLVTSRRQSHWQRSTEKTSKGSTLPSPGMQHKGLLHTASCVATTRKTLNMTVLQFHSALGCSPLLKRKLTPTASSQTHPFSSCKTLKSNSESHMEANTCTSNTFQELSRCQAIILWLVLKGAQGASRGAENRDATAQKTQRKGLHCSAVNWTKTFVSDAGTSAGLETTSLPY